MSSGCEYDCVVIGGGPGGATAATVLADHGRRVLVLEKGSFPRHHIGESLMPQTYDVFKRIGMLEKMKASGFPRKESVQFVSASGRESQPFFFTDRDPNEWSITWQVRRDEFDRMMLDNARDHGAEVAFGAHVSEVIFEGDRATGVRATVDGESRTFTAKVVVDASGQSSLLSRQLGLRYVDPKLRNASIYTYYKGATRDEGRNAGATIIIHTPNRDGWFWFIPLCDDVASVGVVAPPSRLFSGRGDDPLTTFEGEVENCIPIKERLSSATRISQAHVISDYSYMSRKMAGDGWLLIGDAFGFLDPVYSSGVFVALKSGEFAADAVHDAIGAGDCSGARLGAYGSKLVDGIWSLKRMVHTFYDERFSFGAFLQEHPQYRDHIVRLLIGDVFNDDVEEVFEELGKWVDLPGPIVLEESAGLR
jgi:geranylgeranyl reductase family protein